MTVDRTPPRAALVEALTEKANYLRRRSELPTEARRTDAELGYEAELDAAVSGLLTRAAEALREATITVPDEGVVGSPERDLRVIASRLNADLEAGTLHNSTYWCVRRLVEIADATAALRQDRATVTAAAEETTKHLGCQDNSCLFKRPKGWATNGGCRCKQNPRAMATLAALYRAAIQQVGQRPEGEGQ